MPSFTVTVTDNATDRLGNIGPTAKQALERVLRPLTQELHSDVLSRAEAHIHTVGKKPGAYLASIQIGQYDKGKRMGGFVRSGSPLAHLLESGAKPPPHAITANAASVLTFSGDAGDRVPPRRPASRRDHSALSGLRAGDGGAPHRDHGEADAGAPRGGGEAMIRREDVHVALLDAMTATRRFQDRQPSQPRAGEYRA